MTDRQIKILDIISKNQKSEVKYLSELLGFSHVTIRKDLGALEESGFIKREHGFAVLGKNDDISRSLASNYSLKRKIAKAASECVDEGETVMIESGSCCALLAQELANSKKDITIITNSVFIANFIRYASRTRIIVLGGYYQPDSQVLVGPMTRKCGEIFFSDKFFVGADGFIPDFGFTGKDHLRSQTIMDMADSARDIIVLTDSEKFHCKGTLGVIELNRVKEVYTDDRISTDIEKNLLKNKIILHKVPGAAA